MHIQEH